MARVALLICVGFSVYAALQRLMYCVAHHLSGRYTIKEKNEA
ncbi:DUF3265 domain-containing protein [Vibrio parahaemolyticus]|nr:DUF3265 domain-containing protein [Vibrio parahaemolyticus]EGQ9512470.1 DUF3265 domain-containing protein [Vibrio parahaemolyticus]EGR2045602.1 DUF3265 domain-containing protein [Vibrio parahaemolyticus]EGR2845524.1 DUF3265 domain-containing protein [Vibrio parahaemolyticus]EGR3042855.1 DUF3265 domain-containing protein [Vibrio parahaemolyticus]